MVLKTGNNGAALTIGDLETSNYQIQASGKMFEILSSKLYTDKIMAPIRELICNAYDAHKMVGNESKHIEVHIPTNIKPEFAVRDFGPGLSMEEMRNLYTTYGASDKADSNDFIGCLGLGSKSPFAYTDTFTVTSRHKGKKFLFCCSMSGGCPNITGMEADSDKQPDGLEVRFTVNMGDFLNFEKSVERFAEFFCAPIESIKDGVRKTLNPRDVDWGKYDVAVIQDVQVGEIGVVMGGVLYSCNVPSHSSVSPLTKEQYNDVLDAVRCLGYRKRFFIKAPLGAVDIAASREHCEMTARTSSFVMTKLYDFISAVENDTLATLKAKKLPTLKFFCEWDAALRNFEFLCNNNLNKAIRNFLSTTGLCVHANDPTSMPILDTVLHVAVYKPSNQRRRAFYTHFDNEANFKALNGSRLRVGRLSSTVTELCSERVLVIDVSAKAKAKFMLPKDVHDLYQRVTDFFLIDQTQQTLVQVM